VSMVQIDEQSCNKPHEKKPNPIMCSALVQGVMKASCTISGLFIVGHLCGVTVWRLSGGLVFWRVPRGPQQLSFFRFWPLVWFCICLRVAGDWCTQIPIFQRFLMQPSAPRNSQVRGREFFFWIFFILVFMWLALVCFIFYFGVLHYKRFWTPPFYLKNEWIFAFCFLFWRFVDLMFFDLRLRTFLRFLDFDVLKFVYGILFCNYT
jgi:hypothetical protein